MLSMPNAVRAVVYAGHPTRNPARWWLESNVCDEETPDLGVTMGHHQLPQRRHARTDRH